MEQREASEWNQGAAPQVKNFRHDAAQKPFGYHLCRYLLLAGRRMPALTISRKEEQGRAWKNSLDVSASGTRFMVYLPSHRFVRYVRQAKNAQENMLEGPSLASHRNASPVPGPIYNKHWPSMQNLTRTDAQITTRVESYPKLCS